MITETLTPHPYAACYPLVSGALEESLLESIKHNGLRQPIVLWRDEERSKVWLIDGRNRHRALCQLFGGVDQSQVIWQSYESDEAVRLAVLDYNENRRQMSTAQKSVVAGRIIEARALLLETIENTQERKKQVSDILEEVSESVDEAPFDLDDKGDSASSSSSSDATILETSELTSVRAVKMQRDCPPEVRREVASTLGIGAKTAQRGAAVVGRGSTNLVSALEEGLVSVEAAYTLTQLEDEELEAVVAQGKEMMRERARELKGAEKIAKDEAKRNEILGDVEVDKLSLIWTERSEEGERHFSIEVDDPEKLNKLLMTLSTLGLRGHKMSDEEDEETENH